MTFEAIWRPENQQQIYRQLLEVMSRPGTIADIGALLDQQPAWLGTLATLIDQGTTLADPGAMIDACFTGLLETSLHSADAAAFVLADGAQPPDFSPCRGDIANPDQGATLILTVAKIGQGRLYRLSGPGIVGERPLQIDGLDPVWLEQRAQWNDEFPTGVDMIFCDRHRICAWPRSTRIEGA